MTATARQIASEYARQAIDNYALSGKPWPLEIMLRNMNYFYEVAVQKEVEIQLRRANGTPFEELKPDIHLSEVARMRAEECAKDASSFCHPKLAQIEVSGETESTVKHLHAHVILEKLQDRSDADLAKLYQSVVSGEDIPELIEAAADANEAQAMGSPLSAASTRQGSEVHEQPLEPQHAPEAPKTALQGAQNASRRVTLPAGK